MRLLSNYLKFYDHIVEPTVEKLLTALSPGKVMPSEWGWLFLANDANDFLRFQFGLMRWSEEDRVCAANMMRQRAGYCDRQQTIYQKFIVPEKSVVYSEYLPSILGLLPDCKRPAQMLAMDWPGTVSYLGDYLRDARSLGQNYFRGDTHPNWLGGWLIYRQIMLNLAAAGVTDGKFIPLSGLISQNAAWEGDLWTQLTPDQRDEFDRNWGFTLPSYGFDIASSLTLRDEIRKAWPVAVPTDYRDWFNSRETFVYERKDGQGPKAVVFRDSTLDLCLDYLAQHFSRSVFVWHQGQLVDEVVERERPDVVIHVMAERFVCRYPFIPPIMKVREHPAELIPATR